jgi:hypothetical protein
VMYLNSRQIIDYIIENLLLCSKIMAWMLAR